MKKNIVAYEGSSFNVDLESMTGSTCYGWALTKLPKGIVLLGTEDLTADSNDAGAIGPVIQRFYFGVCSPSEIAAKTIKFKLISFLDFRDIADKAAFEVKIIPKVTEPENPGTVPNFENQPFINDPIKKLREGLAYLKKWMHIKISA